MENFKYKLMKNRAKDIYNIGSLSVLSGDYANINMGYHNFLKVIIDSKEPKDLIEKGIIFKDLPTCKGIITKAYNQYTRNKILNSLRD